MEDEKRFFVALKGVVMKDDKVLIIKRSKGARSEHHYWEFPGGKLEFGENPEETLIREVMEETGLDVKPLFPVGSWKLDRDENTQMIGITYCCEAKNADIVLSNEHSDYAWSRVEELNNYKLYPDILNDVQKWDWDYIKKNAK